MRKQYQSYTEIPPTVQDYLLTVAGEKHIMDIPLEEINVFLNGLHKYHKTKEEEFSEGWIE